MPGAETQLNVANIPRRGMRRPRHTGQIFRQTSRQIRPFMAAPIRPGETLESISLHGETWMNSMVNLVQAPLTYTEVGVWYIPLHAYGPEFVDIFETDAEQIAERGAAGADLAGAAGDATFPAGVGQGHLSVGGYQQANRPWAGEHGNESDLGSSYVPYSSHGAYIIGENYYGLDNGQDFRNSALLQNPPIAEPFIRGATLQSHAIGTGGIDPDPSAETSFTQMLESLFLLSQPSRTMSEVLAGFGVNPRRASGMPVPLLLEQKVLKGQTQAQPYTGTLAVGVNDGTEDVGVGSTFGGTRFGTVVTSDADAGILHGLRPMGSMRSVFDVQRNRGITADNFGIILGTVCTWPIFSTRGSFGHMMDATRLLNLGNWGDPSFGGIEETDFMAIQDLYTRDGVTENSQQVFNLLNLYLHGDEFAEHAQDGQDAFTYRGPGGDTYDPSSPNGQYTSKMSVQLNIRTDLVG